MVEGKEDVLKQYLDEGGRLIIKKQQDYMIVAEEMEIDGKKYHIGSKFQSSEELLGRWNKLVETALMTLRRKKLSLKEA